MFRQFFVTGLVFISFQSWGLAADSDWPQWRGPNRDGHAGTQTLLQTWPDGGPELKWSFSNAGTGFSTVVLVGGKIYTLGADDQSCFAVCLNANDGSEIWRQSFSRAGVDDDYNQNWGGGPRGTPTVAGDQLFCFSETGTLASLDTESGKLNWKVDVVAEYGGKIPVWGYSESPLVDGDRVIVTPGGENFMIALDRETGKQVWGSQGIDVPAHFSSAIKGTFAGTPFYVTASKPGLIAIDAATGQQLFADTATGNQTAVIPTPLLIGPQVYHTSDYGAGSTLLNLTTAGEGTVGAEPVYHQTGNTMRNKHGGVVVVDRTVFGFSQAKGGAWMAQDLATGDLLWFEKIRPNTSGSICYADGRLYCYNDKDASVILVHPSRDGWQPRGKVTLPRQTEIPRGSGAIWAHPIVAAGMLLVRDQDLIFAYDIARP